MKKIYRFLLLLALPLLGACDGWLDKPDSDDITVDQAFETVRSARMVLNNIYYELRTGDYNVNSRNIPYALGCDDAIAGYSVWGQKFQNGSWTADDNAGASPNAENDPPTVSYWMNTYKRIRKCNLFMENLHLATGDEADKVRMMAEARALRAFFYAELIRRFGGIIIIDHSVDPNDYTELTNQARSTLEESVEWVCNELRTASIDLPMVCTAADIGRFTQAACYATIARLRITVASPLFNTDSPVLADYTTTQYYGNYDKERWKLAADACRFIMNQSGVYGLDLEKPTNVAEGSQDFYFLRFTNRYFTVGDESILIAYEREQWGWVRIPYINRQSGGWNWVNPSYQLAMEFEMMNGKMPNEAGSGYDMTNPNNDRDPRFRATIQYPGASYPGVTWLDPASGVSNAYKFEPWMGGGSSHLESQRTGMCLQKYIDPEYNDVTADSRNLRKNIIHIFRYNEILLIFAEAMNEYSGPTQEVYNAVNAIRERVGMPALPSGLSQDQMREKIRHERRVEMAFEDFRFFDIRRWRIAEQVCNGVNIQGYDVTKGKDGGFYTIVNVGDPLVFEKKHYLYPLPTKELLLNPSLEQNPGWPKLTTAGTATDSTTK